MNRFFEPRSIALIGASTREETIGGKVLQNLLAAGFTGAIYPINPKAESIQGIRSYPSISVVPDPVDLALVVLPRDLVLPVVRECGEAGVGAVAVISAGFGEMGEEGRRLEMDLAETARRYGMRLLGPNCMGAINTASAVGMDATFSPTPALPGSVGLVSQSGALGVAILNMAADLGLGFSSFLSIGNGADVGVADALAWWSQDDRTRVVAMYLESIESAQMFLETARELARRKPVIALKAGRTEAGARAASSHTGALVTGDLVADALLRQCGVLRAQTVQDLCEWAAAFERCPLPSGGRVAVVTNAGGPGILAADACSMSGLDLPVLAEGSQKALRAFLPDEAAVANPVDMIASATVEDYRKAVEIVMADPGIDMVLVVNVTPPVLYEPIDVVEALSSIEGKGEKPCVGVFMTSADFFQQAARVAGAPPIYRYPESAARVLRALLDYAERRDMPTEEFVALNVDTSEARAIVAEAMASVPAARKGPFQVAHEHAAALLNIYGVGMPQDLVVHSPAEAGEAAARMGGKVALKALRTDLLHKSDVGGVALHLEGEDEVRNRAERMNQDLAEGGNPLEGFLVQSMAGSGIELIVGARRDSEHGAVLMVGLGGLFAEALEDVQIRLLPVNATDARQMLESLKGHPLLAGESRGPGVHLDSVVELLGRVARMMMDLPELHEVELNPVICTDRPGSCVAVDAVVRMERI